MIDATQRKNLLWLVVFNLLVVVAHRYVEGGGFAPPPFATDGLSLLIVEEAKERSDLPYDQLMILTGTGPDSVKAWLDQNCGKSQSGPQKGLPHWRILDKDDVVTEMEEPWVKEAMAVQRDGVPWMIVANKRTGFSLPLSNNTEEMLAKLKPLGGK